MSYFVYILLSQIDKKRYIGCTSNLDIRLMQHNTGFVKSTRNRRPLNLIHTELFSSKEEALKREKFYKSGKGREYLKNNHI